MQEINPRDKIQKRRERVHIQPCQSSRDNRHGYLRRRSISLHKRQKRTSRFPILENGYYRGWLRIKGRTSLCQSWLRPSHELSKVKIVHR